jgi:hypothetical protein
VAYDLSEPVTGLAQESLAFHRVKDTRRIVKILTIYTNHTVLYTTCTSKLHAAVLRLYGDRWVTVQIVTRAVQVCYVSLRLHSYRCVTDVYRRVTVGYSPQRKVRRNRCYVALVQLT